MTQTVVYIPVDEENENSFGWVTPSIKNMKSDVIDIVPIEKKENVYVFTPQEFEKVIFDAKREERDIMMKTFAETAKLNEKLKWD